LRTLALLLPLSRWQAHVTEFDGEILRHFLAQYMPIDREYQDLLGLGRALELNS